MTIEVGSLVLVEDQHGMQHWLVLVPDGSDLHPNSVTTSSPTGCSLLGRRPGDSASSTFFGPLIVRDVVPGVALTDHVAWPSGQQP